ncbi:hypothetical protein Gpo141_00003961 [Globisporangium polare]
MFKSFLAALLLTAASTGVAHAFAPCASGMSEISVEGINGIFCVSGSMICAAQISQGACPGVQDGLAYGSYCGTVFSGVYGCKVLDSQSVTTFQPWVDPNSTPAPTPSTDSPTPTPTPSTAAPTPAPTPSTAAPTPTPTPSTDAPTPVPTPSTDAPTAAPTPSTDAPTPAPTPSTAAPTPAPSTAMTSPSPSPSTSSCANSGAPVSVEGVQGVFCVTGTNICAANLSTGVCPAAQSGLPFGSYCGKVASGVYGCKVLTDNAGGQSSTTNSGTGTSGSTTTTTSTTSTTPSMAPASSTPAPSTSISTTTTASSADCPNGGSPMSIEGVQKIFCVSGIACAADIATGNCPGKQDGLKFGSYCDLVRTGVYGCRAYIDDNTKADSTVAPPRSCAGNPAGNTPVSIVSAKRDFCAQEPICSGDHFGNCPSIQDGLDQVSACAVLPNGVHGCVFFK